MIHIEKADEPDFWHNYRHDNPSERYDDLENTEEGKNVRFQLRQFNIDGQHGLCAYCCTSITSEKSINEHIKPREKFANLSMEYDNIVACCISSGTETTCSSHKANHYNGNLFVSPLDQDCESYFEYYSNGEVVSDSPKGQYTIELLNLNSYKLRRARAAQLQVCKAYSSPELVRKLFITPDTNNRIMPFVDIVKFYFKF